MKVLLHVCCAPCALGVIDRVAEDNEVTLFFYNPNIYPIEEYDKRLNALLEIIERKYPDMPLIKGEYDSVNFFNGVVGLEKEKEGGKRCEKCIAMRMEKTAETAKRLKFDAFTTTLSVSPHKSYPLIAEIGESLQQKYQVKFIATDFKKQDGFLKSTKLSKEMGIYRQNYCGCKYSIND